MTSKKTYVVEINGEGVMAFRADTDDEAHDQVHGEESECRGIKTVLTEYDRADGGVIWDGSSDIVVRRATDAEHERWRQSRDAAYEDGMMDEPDDWNIFLIPITDPLSDDNEDEDDDESQSALKRDAHAGRLLRAQKPLDEIANETAADAKKKRCGES